MAFSSSSLTTLAGRSMTSPAAIWGTLRSSPGTATVPAGSAPGVSPSGRTASASGRSRRGGTGGTAAPSPAFSLPPVAALLALPEGAERAVLAHGKVLPLLVRAAHVALAHRHLLDAVLEEEVLQLLLHFRVRRDIRRHPPHQDRLGPLVRDDGSGDLGGPFVVGSVAGDGADGEAGLPRLLSLPLPGPLPAVLLLVFRNRGLPLGQILLRDQVPVLLSDE